MAPGLSWWSRRELVVYAGTWSLSSTGTLCPVVDLCFSCSGSIFCWWGYQRIRVICLESLYDPPRPHVLLFRSVLYIRAFLYRTTRISALCLVVWSLVFYSYCGELFAMFEEPDFRLSWLCMFVGLREWVPPRESFWCLQDVYWEASVQEGLEQERLRKMGILESSKPLERMGCVKKGWEG